jgi:hypothetical protein
MSAPDTSANIVTSIEIAKRLLRCTVEHITARHSEEMIRPNFFFPA